MPGKFRNIGKLSFWCLVKPNMVGLRTSHQNPSYRQWVSLEPLDPLNATENTVTHFSDKCASRIYVWSLAILVFRKPTRPTSTGVGSTARRPPSLEGAQPASLEAQASSSEADCKLLLVNLEIAFGGICENLTPGNIDVSTPSCDIMWAWKIEAKVRRWFGRLSKQSF